MACVIAVAKWKNLTTGKQDVTNFKFRRHIFKSDNCLEANETKNAILEIFTLKIRVFIEKIKTINQELSKFMLKTENNVSLHHKWEENNLNHD